MITRRYIQILGAVCTKIQRSQGGGSEPKQPNELVWTKIKETRLDKRYTSVNVRMELGVSDGAGQLTDGREVRA